MGAARVPAGGPRGARSWSSPRPTTPTSTSRVYDDAERRAMLVNVVDVPPLCNFILPAIVRTGPAGDRDLDRRRLARAGQAHEAPRSPSEFGEPYARLAVLLNDARGWAKGTLPTYQDRKAFFEGIVNGEPDPVDAAARRRRGGRARPDRRRPAVARARGRLHSAHAHRRPHRLDVGLAPRGARTCPGPLLAAAAEEAGCEVVAMEVVPDDFALIEDRLHHYVDDGLDARLHHRRHGPDARRHHARGDARGDRARGARASPRRCGPRALQAHADGHPLARRSRASPGAR